MMGCSSRLNKRFKSAGLGLEGKNSLFKSTGALDVGVVSDGSSSVSQELLVDSSE